jgi:protein-S-isoprenylcysteine O-methyltransferase Ste14
MYVFLDLTILGVALALQSWWVLLVLMILLPLQIWNARRESKLLAERFGAEYQAWRSRTWL